MRSALLIFIKNPALGRVKTRLAKNVGEANALKVYQYLLQHVKEITYDLDIEKFVYYDEFIPTKDEWHIDQYEKALQKGSHLGEKMSNAFTKAFEEEDFSKVVLIQPDCPKMTDTLLEKAFKMLETNDFVIGQTEDDGVYLLGMRNNDVSIFESFNYENATNYHHTLACLEKTGKSISKLPILKDIDTEEDLGVLKKMIS
jgi:rSAM/selenodomain-associated transferase 1